MKMYSVKDGELECREVDADFFEKNTTLGGLLTPNEVELASRDDLTVEPLIRFPYLTSNMMATDTKDYDEPDWYKSDKVELDNEIVTDGRTIKVTAENWGKSAILEKAKEIREALELATDYGYKPSVSIIADQFEYTNKMPRQLTLADLDNVKIHDRICLELNNIYEKKNADYGNSFENSLDKHGMIAGIVRMDDKMSRLISLNSKNEQQVMDESMRDTLMDLANYAIMSVMWLDEQ